MNDLAHRTENDNDLHGDPDAQHWAERFVAVRSEVKFKHARDIADDPETMLAWFASAIATGRMAEQPSFGSDTTTDVVTDFDPAGDRPIYIAFFDQYNEWTHQAALGWPQNGQWCPRHWAPGAHGYNGIGAAVALMEAFASSEDLLAADMSRDPESLNRAMLRIVKEFGAICCALGEQEMYRIWQDWPAEARRPGQIDPA